MMIGGPADGEEKKSRLGRMRKPKSSAEGGGRQDRLQLFFVDPRNSTVHTQRITQEREICVVQPLNFITKVKNGKNFNFKISAGVDLHSSHLYSKAWYSCS